MGEKVLKYSLLKHKIIEKVNNEEYKVDCLIPSERELMQMYNVSRITVRKAVDDLVNEGYLYRIQGKGTYVRSDETSHDLFSLTSCTQDLRSRGLPVSIRVIGCSIVPADRRRARKLQIKDGEPLLRLERVFYSDNVPVNYTTTYLPLAIFPGLEKYDFSKESLYSVIENEYNIKITHAKRTLEAILAHNETSEYLEVRPGEPLILFRCETYGEIDGEEQIVESFKCCYRTDMHKFYINQVR